MWELIVKKQIPPTRIMRYCCEKLKERGGQKRFVATGVRWDEGTNRRKRGSLELQPTAQKKNNIILNADNDENSDENRRMFEKCITQGKRILNPIIDWSVSDIWDFLKHYGCQSNPLYEQGYKRIGCIGCPMVSGIKRIVEFEKYPKYKASYIRAFERMLKRMAE